MENTLQAHIDARNTSLRTHLGPGAEHYLGVLQDRADRFAAHVATMNLSPAITTWALHMSARFGEYVKVHHFIADWVTALLIIRYGEEPDAKRSTDVNFKGWPTSFTRDDLKRAGELLNGGWSKDLTVLTAEEA